MTALALNTKIYAASRDPRLRDRLLRQFDRGAVALRGFLSQRFGDDDLDAIIAEVRDEYEGIIERLPWIGGSANPRSFNLYGSALWLALWRVLKPRGLTLDEAQELFCDIFRAYWSRYPRLLRRLYGRARMGPANQRRVRRLAMASQRRASSFPVSPGTSISGSTSSNAQSSSFSAPRTPKSSHRFCARSIGLTPTWWASS
jgi:hypothetical protein